MVLARAGALTLMSRTELDATATVSECRSGASG